MHIEIQQSKIVNRKSKFALIALASVMAIFPGISKAEESAQDDVLNPREVYIPREDWNVIALRSEGGVTLSWEEYQDLLKRARESEATERPPLDILPAESSFEVRFNSIAPFEEMLMMSLGGEVRIDKLEDGWGVHRFDLGGVIVHNASVSGDKDFLIRDNSGKYHYFVFGSGPHTLTISTNRLLAENSGNYVIDAIVPSVGQGQMVVYVPAGMSLLDPSRTGPRGEPVSIADATRSETEVSASVAVGGRSNVSYVLSRQQRIEAPEPVVSSFEFARTQFGLDSILMQSNFEFSIARRKVVGFEFEMPAGLRILDIEGADIGEEQRDESGKMLTIRLSEPASSSYRLSIVGDMAFLVGEESRTTLQRIKPTRIFVLDEETKESSSNDLTLTRSIESVVFEVGLKGKMINENGYRQIDEPSALLSHFAPPEAGAVWQTAPVYYAATGYETSSSIEIEPVNPRVVSWCDTSLSISLDKTELVSLVHLNVREGEARLIRVRIPAGFTLREVKDSLGASLRFDATDNVARIFFKEAVTMFDGNTDLRLTFDTKDKEWEQGAQNIQMPAPLVTPMEVERESSSFLLMRERGISIESNSFEGLRPEEPLAVLVSIWKITSIESLGRLEAIGAWFYSGDTASGILSLTRKTPRVSSTLVTYNILDEASLTVASVIAFDIADAPTGSLTINISGNISDGAGDLAKFESAPAGLIKSKVREKVDESTDRWTLTLQRPLMRENLLEISRSDPLLYVYVSFEIPLAGRKSMTMPRVLPQVEGSLAGFYAIASSLPAEIEFTPSGMERLEVEDVPPFAHPSIPRSSSLDFRGEFINAFRFAGADHSLSIALKEDVEAEVIGAVIRELEAHTLVEPAGESYLEKTIIRIEYGFVPNRAELALELPEGAKLLSALVEGEGIKPVESGKSVKIVIERSSSEHATIVVILERAIEKFGSSGDYKPALPKFADGSIPIVEASWHLYLPPGFEYVDSEGNPVGPDEEKPEPLAISLGRQIVTGAIRLFQLPEGKLALDDIYHGSETQMAPTESTGGWDEFYSSGGSGSSAESPAEESPTAPDVVTTWSATPAEEANNFERTSGSRFRGENGPVADSASRPARSQDPSLARPPSGALAPATPAPPSISPPATRAPAATPAPQPSRAAPANGLTAGRIGAALEDGEGEAGGGSGEWAGAPSDVFIADAADNRVHIFGDLGVAGPGRGATADEGRPDPWQELLSEHGFIEARQHGLLSINIPFPVDQSREIKFRSLSEDLEMTISYQHEDRKFARTIFWILAAFTLALFYARKAKFGKLMFFLGAMAIVTLIPEIFGREWSTFFNPIFLGILMAAAVTTFSHFGSKLRAKLVPAKLMVLIALGLTFALADTSYARETQRRPQQPAPTGNEDARTEVYIPYDPAEFDQTERSHPAQESVFVGRTTYLELLRRADPERFQREMQQHAPVDDNVRSARYKLGVSTDDFRFDATFVIENFRDSQQLVPVGLGDTAIVEARLTNPDGAEETVSLASANGGFGIVIPKKGVYSLYVRARPNVVGYPSGGFFKSSIVPVISSSCEVETRPGVNVVLGRGTVEGGIYEVTQNERTSAVLAIGGLTQLEIYWETERSLASARDAEFNTTLSCVFKLSAGYSEFQTRMIMRPRQQRSVNQIIAMIPENQIVNEVRGAEVARWTIDADNRENGRIPLIVHLQGATYRSLDITISGFIMQQFDAETKLLDVPDVLGSVTYDGTVRIEAASPEFDDIVKVADTKNLDRTEGSASGALQAFRISNGARPELSVSIESLPLDVSATIYELLLIDEEKETLVVEANLKATERRMFSREFTVPGDYELKELATGNPYDLLDYYALKREGSTVVRVFFTRGVQDAGVTIRASFIKRRLISDAVKLPKLDFGALRGVQGRVAIAAKPDVDVVRGEIVNIFPIETRNVSDYVPGLVSFSAELGHTLRHAFEFYSTAHSGTFTYKPRVSTVAAEAFFDVALSDEWTLYHALLNVTIEGANEDTFVFSLPASLPAPALITAGTSTFRELRREPVTEGEQQFFKYTAVLSAPLPAGTRFTIEITYDRVPQSESASDGESIFSIPQLRLEGFDRSTLLLLVSNTSSSQLSFRKDASQGVVDITAEQLSLPSVLSQFAVRFAFRVAEPGYKVEFTRSMFRASDLQGAEINLVDALTVTGRDGVSRTRVLYRLQNRSLQHLLLQMPEDAKIWSCYLLRAGEIDRAARPVQIARRGDLLVIPIVKTLTGDCGFFVELVYEIRVGSLDSLDTFEPSLPHVTNVKSIGKTIWTLALPDEFEYRAEVTTGRLEGVDDPWWRALEYRTQTYDRIYRAEKERLYSIQSDANLEVSARAQRNEAVLDRLLLQNSNVGQAVANQNLWWDTKLDPLTQFAGDDWISENGYRNRFAIVTQPEFEKKDQSLLGLLNLQSMTRDYRDDDIESDERIVAGGTLASPGTGQTNLATSGLEAQYNFAWDSEKEETISAYSEITENLRRVEEQAASERRRESASGNSNIMRQMAEEDENLSSRLAEMQEQQVEIERAQNDLANSRYVQDMLREDSIEEADAPMQQQSGELARRNIASNRSSVTERARQQQGQQRSSGPSFAEAPESENYDEHIVSRQNEAMNQARDRSVDAGQFLMDNTEVGDKIDLPSGVDQPAGEPAPDANSAPGTTEADFRELGAIVDYSDESALAELRELSIRVDLPLDGRCIVLSRVGGDPRLVLSVRDPERFDFIFGLLRLIAALSVLAIAYNLGIFGASPLRELGGFVYGSFKRLLLIAMFVLSAFYFQAAIAVIVVIIACKFLPAKVKRFVFFA
ncbi:MAG: hypothetical protein NUW37_10715 [Planctomycetes bacterium]|nr:hypothetical protein [Planctomycetota bacterium]